MALITAGALILGDVAITLAWQEPMSSLYASILQDDAEEDLASLEESFPRAAGRTEAALRRKVKRLADRFEDEVVQGQGIGVVEIPEIDADFTLVEGVDIDELEAGPGRYSSAAMPGQGTTVAIAGHRTTFLAPFRDIDELEEGDEVSVTMPYADFTYVVERKRIVEPDRLEVVRPVDHERLVLTACHPLRSAAQRYVVTTRLADVSERDEA